MFRCSSCGALNRLGASQAGAQPVCGKCKGALDTSGAPQEVNAEQLARVIDSSPVPVLVDFWAPWCGPCRAAAPILDEVSRAHAGAVVTVKLNTDQNPSAAAAHRIQGIPTFAIFSGGQEVARQSGILPRAQFTQWLRSRVGSASADEPRHA